MRCRLALVAVGVIAVAVPLAGPAHGDDTVAQRMAALGGAGTSARSIGWVWSGLLRHGARIEESARVRHVERFVPAGRFFGTPELVGLFERSAERVWRAYPGARLSIGEVSQEGGGNVPGHRSHENGRDADVGFYLREETGAPIEAPAFVRVWRDGHASFEGRAVLFDVERNWALVQSLVTDEETHVQVIFVAGHVRRRLIRYARNLRLDRELIDRADRMMLPPEGVARHDDHFHVRIYCAPRDRAACSDRGPFWAWVPSEHLPEGAELLPRHYRPAEGQYAPAPGN